MYIVYYRYNVSRLQIAHLSMPEEFYIIKDSSYSFSPSGVLLNIVNIPAQVFKSSDAARLA